MPLNSTEIPAFYFRQFKKGLGDINPYLALVDTSCKLFSRQAAASGDAAKYMRSTAAQTGHPHLYTDHLSSSDVFWFVYITHVSFILSQADLTLALIAKNPFIRPFQGKPKGDMLRKFLVQVRYSKDISHTSDTITDQEVQQFVGAAELQVLDYFRHIRNAAMHSVATARSDITLVARHAALPIASIKAAFNLQPSPPSALTHLDVVLYSKAWQSAMFNICKSFIDHKRDVIPPLQKKYAGKDQNRRDTALINALKQSYLLDDQTISTII